MKFQKIIVVGLIFTIISCSDGGDSSYTLSGKVTGLFGGTLTLQNNGTDDIIIEKEGTFTFRTKANTSDKYSVQVFREPCEQRCEIKNGTGTVSNKDVANIEINCLAKTWSETEEFLKGTDFENVSVEIQDIAMDKKGNIIVLWITHNPYEYPLKDSLYISEFRNGQWNHPRLADKINLKDSFISSGHVAMNNQGEAILVWAQDKAVYKSGYWFGVWENPMLLSDKINFPDNNIIWADVGLADNGDAVVTWGNTEPSFGGIYIAERRNGKWKYPSSENDKLNVGTDAVSWPHLAMNNTGETIIGWLQYGSSEDIFVSEYSNGSWKNPKSKDDYFGESDSYLGDVAINDDGYGIIAWSKKISENNSAIFVSEKKNGVWNHSDHINAELGNAFPPTLALSENGDAIIAWFETGEDYFHRTTFKSERRGGKWDWPVLQKDLLNSTEYISYPSVGIDNYGNAEISWTRWNESSLHDFLSKEYKFNHWEDIKTVGSYSSTSDNAELKPFIAMSECRKAVLWSFWPANTMEVSHHFLRHYH